MLAYQILRSFAHLNDGKELHKASIMSSQSTPLRSKPHTLFLFHFAHFEYAFGKFFQLDLTTNLETAHF